MAGDFHEWQKLRCAAVWMVKIGEHQLWRLMCALETVGDYIPVNSGVTQRFLLEGGIYKRAT